jgi:hypothetical protein
MRWSIVSALALVLAVGCDKKPEAAPTPPPVASPAAPKPAASPAAAAPKASAKPATAKTAPLPDKVKHAVPTDWEVRDHQAKGFSFHVPAGTKEHQESKEGIDIYLAELPKPHDSIQVFVAAFKDPAKKVPEMKVLVEKVIKDLDTAADYKLVKEEALSDQYTLLDVTWTGTDKKKNHAWVLIALDVTDRYFMIVGSDEDKFKASEDTVGAILASFDMYSSGAGSAGEHATE